MDQQQPKSAKGRAAARGKLSRSRAVRSSSSSSSSSSSLSSSSDKDDAAADDESKDFGSRIKLFRERRRSSSSARQKKRQKKVANDEKENRIETADEQQHKQQQQQQESIAKEKEAVTAAAAPSTSIAQTIKKRFGFFRRSESVKSAAAADNVDVEAGFTAKEQDKESLIDSSKIDEDQDESTRVLDVVADVHVENEKQQTKKQDRSVSSSTSPEIVAIESPPPPVEHDNSIEEIGSIDDDDDDDNNEARPTSGRRKRWDKRKPAAEKIGAELLALEEDSKSKSNNKPRQRRQWAKGGAASAEIRNSSGQRILLPERSATAEPVVRPASSRLRSRPPIAAPRSRDPRKEEKGGGFDNEAFSSDHDEVLRIETIDDRSPTIKMSNGGSEYNDDESTTLSEEEDKRLPSDRKSSIEKAEIQDFTAPTTSTNTTTTTESSEIQDSPRNNNKIASLSRRSSKSSVRRKSSGEKRSSGGRGDDDDFDEEDEEEEDQETTTVLTAMERGGSKSRRSSRSSSKKISADNFFEKRRGRSSGDETTTITTNEDMHTSRRDSRKSKSSSRRNEDDKSSSRRSSKHRGKQPTTSSSTTRYSGDERQQQQSQRPQKPPRKSRSKSKRRSRRKKSSDRSDAAAATNDEEEEEQLRYASIRIHRSDMLEADYLTRRPMVKVHLVYAETGEYPRSRGAKPSDEQQSLLPIATDRFDFRAKRSMVPVWEQELVFEFNYRHLLAQGRAAVVLLFEIIDRVSGGGGDDDDGGGSFDRNDTRDPYWYKVAWAFLRPVGVNGAQHVDKRVRLQLYRPKKAFWRCSTITTRRNNNNKNNNSKTPTRCDIYKWWKSSSSSRVKYPSSLYVTVCGVEPSTPRLLESVRMMTRHRDDEQPLKIDDLTDLNNDEDDNNKSGCRPMLDEESSRMTTTMDKLGRPKWTRHAAQSCQIPNDLAWETSETSERGCFALAFSHDGKYLACACSEEYDYPILVYKLDDGKLSVRFAGHKNFVYSVQWSGDDRQLVTCSSDQTARVWDVAEKIIEPLQALPHPSYVYCSQFLGSNSGSSSSSIVTGCYDHVARVWSRSTNDDFELIQELEGHESFVSAVCCDEAADQLITGDGVGTLIVWQLQAKKTSTTPTTSSSSHRRRHSRVRKEWQIARKLKLKDLEGVTINTLLALGPSAQGRLIVHSRNDELRLLEPATGLVVRKFSAPPQLHRNRRIQARACASPCGGLLFCGGDEASRLCVWSLDTGRLLATYELTHNDNRNHHNQAVTCVDYHPYDHALAYSCYGAPPGQPVRVLRYDRDADGSRVGLRLLQAQAAQPVNPMARIKLEPMTSRNGSATRSLTTATSQNGNLLARFGRVDDSAEDDDDESRSRQHQQQQLKGRVQNFMETGPSLRAKSLSRLSGIIEKIDRILMYATSHHHHQQQKSSGTVMVDVEAARREDDHRPDAAKVFTVTQRNASPVEIIELQDLPAQPSKKPRKRSKSARNACSPTTPDNSAKSFFSDGNHRGNNHRRRYSGGRGSDDSASNRQGQFVFETVDLDKIEDDDNYNYEPEQQQQQQQRKDSLDTIVDGREEDFPSEEVLDVESLKSDDTYVVNKDDDDNDDGVKTAVNNNNNEDGSDRSNATFVIESEIAAAPVPKPRRRIGKIELA